MGCIQEVVSYIREGLALGGAETKRVRKTLLWICLVLRALPHTGNKGWLSWHYLSSWQGQLTQPWLGFFTKLS